MQFERQLIPDIFLIKPKIFSDNRGYFTETFRQDLLERELGYKINFIQENESKSSRGVLRGLHFQLPPFAQAKLVRVSKGKVLDIAVDIRKSSPSFGMHIAVELSEDNKYQVFIPHGFAHGFVVLSDLATLTYKVDNFYSSKHERGVSFDDTSLEIDWQLDSNQLILSGKDKEHPFLSDSIELFK
jgi:dTDP-4-dehydrorhamnose 3,5-epimerase